MKKFVCIIIIVILGISYLLFSADIPKLPKITTVNEIVDNMVKKFEKIRTFTARFYIKSIIEGNEKKSYGTIRYKKPDTFIMVFDKPEDQVIYSDGKILKIYIPELNVVGEQKLESQYRSTFFISGKTSLYYLRSKYNFSFAKSNKPVMIGDTPFYLLLLEPRERLSEFKQIKLWVSRYWIIVKAEAETINDNIITISFSKIRINTRLTEHEFEFNLPVNTQTIVNPLLFGNTRD